MRHPIRPISRKVSQLAASSKDAEVGGTQAAEDLKAVHNAQYIVLVDDIKKDVSEWAKKRLWLIAILGAIVTALGGYHVFEETMRSLVEDKVQSQIKLLTDQSNKYVDKFNDAYQKTSDEIAILRSSSQTAQEIARKAQSEVTTAEGELDKLQQKLTSFDTQASEAEKKINAKIDESANFAHDNVFETTSLDNLLEDIQEAGFLSFDKRLAVIEGAIREANESSNNQDAVKVIVSKLAQQTALLKLEYENKVSHLADNAQKKIILYIKKGEGFTEQALEAAKLLRRRGFKVDVWISQAGGAEEAKEDIGKDFPGARDIIEGRRGAVVVYDNTVQQGEEIIETIGNLPLFHNIDVIPSKMNPDMVFRRRPPESDYAASDIVLVYMIAEVERQ